MVPFLTEEWFEHALQRTSGLGGERPELACRVQFEARSATACVRWFQVVSAGRVVEWRRGECPDAEVEVQLGLAHAWRLWQGEVDGNEAMATMTVAEERPNGRWTGPPAPMDLGQQPELAQLEHYPGLNLDVQYEYQNAPFGPVDFALSIVDGQLDAVSLTRMAEPDVLVRCTFLQMAQVRRGDITILDALVGGATAQGAEGALALLGGISESPEFQAAERACGRSGTALGVLGEVGAGTAYRSTMAALAEITGPPHEL